MATNGRFPCLEQDHLDDPTQSQEEHKKAVVLLDNEIEVLMRKVRQLQFRKSEHLQKIKYYQGLTTLARRLPPELLASIFDECVRDGWTRTPLVASHVCSEWRKATRIPTVWSHVYVNCDAKDPCGRTRFWLQNAASSLLHIILEIKNDATHLLGVMSLLLDRISQWRSLTINSVRLSHSDYIFSLCGRPTPELHAVNISVVQQSDRELSSADTENLNGLLRAFPLAPRFRTLRISHNLFPAQGTIPCSITHLSINLPSHPIPARLSIDTALRFLNDMPALESLSITLERGEAREFHSASIEDSLVVLPELRKLTLLGSQDIFKILSHLSTPALDSLHLRSSLDPVGHGEVQTGFHIKRFIERSSPPLHLFELHDIDLPLSDFLACFAGLPTLRELRLHESDITEAVIERFQGPDALCPMLSRLDLRWCGQVTGQTLVQLARARLGGAHPGERVEPVSMMTIINCSFVTEQDIMDLARLTVCRVVSQPDDYCRQYFV